MNSIITSIGVVLYALILAEGKYILVEIEKPEGKSIHICLELLTYTKKYLGLHLNENIKNLKFLVLGRDVSSETVSRQTKGICSQVPIINKLPEGATNDQYPDRFWSCSQSAFLKPERATAEEFKQGNYVQFDVRDKFEIVQGFVLNIIGINDKYCDPPVKECTCDELLDKMLKSKEGHELTKTDEPMNKAVEEIHYVYNVETCQCMLSNAEKVGFKWASLINPQVPPNPKKCARLLPVNSNENESSPRFLCEELFNECNANRIVLFKRLL